MLFTYGYVTTQRTHWTVEPRHTTCKSENIYFLVLHKTHLPVPTQPGTTKRWLLCAVCIPVCH